VKEAIESPDPGRRNRASTDSGHGDLWWTLTEVIARAIGLLRGGNPRLVTLPGVHDVGKRSCSRAPILNKPRTLTDENSRVQDARSCGCRGCRINPLTSTDAEGRLNPHQRFAVREIPMACERGDPLGPHIA